MGKSESNDTRSKALIPIGVGALALAGVIFWYFSSGRGTYAAGDAFFSDDDGKTFFSDTSERFPPFSHAGKEAVGARVFLDSTGKPFVGYLERYTEAGQKRAAELLAERTAGKGNPGRDDVLYANMELKRPNAKEWIRANDPKSAEIRKIMCPDKPTQPAMPHRPSGQ